MQTIFFYKDTGRILLVISGEKNMDIVDESIKESVDFIVVDSLIPSRMSYLYKVINKQVIKIEEDELLETQLLCKLVPSSEEIQKAKNTIEILTLIQEVM